MAQSASHVYSQIAGLPSNADEAGVGTRRHGTAVRPTSAAPTSASSAGASAHVALSAGLPITAAPMGIALASLHAPSSAPSASRSAHQPHLDDSDTTSGEDDALLLPIDDDATGDMSDTDRALFASLPPPGIGGRLKPRSRGSARFYYHVNRCLDRLPHCLDGAMRGIGPALVLIAWLLFFACAWVYFADILPCYSWSLLGWPSCLVTPFGLGLLWNIYYNHAMAVFTPPGRLPADWPVPSDIHQRIRHESATLVKGEGFSQYCKTCVRPKAPRMHHCHVCKTCVLRMDHHCPWIGGCTGYANYTFFYNFLFWLEVGCLYLVALTLPLIAWPTEEQFVAMYTKRPEGRLFAMHEAPVFFILMLTAAASIAVGAMLALHTYLLVTNQTTIEMYANGRQKARAQRRGDPWWNPYDLGWRRNITATLGSVDGGGGRGGGHGGSTTWLWCSLFPKPLGLARLEGDGTQFELNPKMSVDYYSTTRGQAATTV